MSKFGANDRREFAVSARRFSTLIISVTRIQTPMPGRKDFERVKEIAGVIIPNKAYQFTIEIYVAGRFYELAEDRRIFMLTATRIDNRSRNSFENSKRFVPVIRA